MKKPTPLFATSKTAAALLEMKEREFLEHVNSGALPPAGKFDRWDVEELQRVMRGDLINGGHYDDVDW